jgi:uncharacterized membrane protein YccC
MTCCSGSPPRPCSPSPPTRAISLALPASSTPPDQVRGQALGLGDDAPPAHPHDRARWRYLARWRALVSSRSGFLLPVRVLAKLFRRLFLTNLQQLHAAGRLQFFGDHLGLSDRHAFLRHLAPLRKKRWVVYSKPPFSGPEAVLAYLSRYTHRVAISNRRLIAFDETGVTFRYKDYRRDGADRQRTMTLSPDEFIRRFLLHVLPKGFHRIVDMASLLAPAARLTSREPESCSLRQRRPCVNRHFHDRADDGQIALPAVVASRQCHAREPLFSSDTTGKWQLAINAAPIPPHQNLQIPITARWCPAGSCLGGFRTPAPRLTRGPRGPASENLHQNGHLPRSALPTRLDMLQPPPHCLNPAGRPGRISEHAATHQHDQQVLHRNHLDTPRSGTAAGAGRLGHPVALQHSRRARAAAQNTPAAPAAAWQRALGPIQPAPRRRAAAGRHHELPPGLACAQPARGPRPERADRRRARVGRPCTGAGKSSQWWSGVMSQAGVCQSGPRRSFWHEIRRLVHALPSAVPALLFGLRLWVAVCLSLYIAFWLELDNAFWAGTSAAIVCQPRLGASLRKGWYRMVGTIIGAVAIVVLTACFPQNRVAFLLGLALWGAVCALAATLLRNFASYSAALAGITAAIIASDQLGAVGGLNGEAFRLAVARASEICIGIVCAGVVLAATDLGGAARRLAVQLASIAAEIMGRFTSTLSMAGSDLPDTRADRRGLIGRVVALDPVIDEALGESAQLRYHSPVFQMTMDGLFAALAGWSTVATRLELLPHDQAREEAGVVLQLFPKALRSAPLLGEPTRWVEHPASLRVACGEAVRALSALPTDAPSLRLLADQAADILSATSQALLTLGLLVYDPAGPDPPRGSVRLRVPDWLPALVNAARAFVTIGLAALFWIVTAWPNGALAIAFAAIAVILFSPRADQAYAAAVSFLVGIGLTAVLAAIVDFAVLPSLTSFTAFSVAFGLVLLPAGALMAQPWQTAMFTAMAFFFVPLLAPANQMNYDPLQFYNASSAIVIGVATAALAFRLLPPLSPALRTRRLLALTLRELRRLATGPIPGTAHDWQSRIYSRLSVLPDRAEPLQRAQLLAALCVGVDIIRLRRVAPLFEQPLGLDAALKAVADGNSVVAAERLAQLERQLAALPGARPGPQIRLRARASIVALAEALTRHAAYFDRGAAG